MSYYESKVVPYLEKSRRINPLTKVPFLGTAFELKELGKQLTVDEEILGLSECKVDGGQQILATVTNKRLILIKKGLILKRAVVSYPSKDIVSVAVRRDFLKGSIRITLQDGNEFWLEELWWTDTEEFQHQIDRSRIGG